MGKVEYIKHDWPKKPVSWIENRTRFVSIPFTWNLPDVREELKQLNLFYDKVVVGGPAVYLMPNFFEELPHVTVGYDMPGILQRVNPNATRTTIGCVNRCKFCAVPTIEGRFKPLEDWPDLPILCDNNILAAPMDHFTKVILKLRKWERPDFNQGLDVRILNQNHAALLATLYKPILRLAFDDPEALPYFDRAYGYLRSAGVAKRRIRCYCLIGYSTTPGEAWERCMIVERGYKIKVLPQWYHALDALKYNTVTAEQKRLGWTDEQRKKIMQYYYQHRTSNENRSYKRKRKKGIIK